MAVACAAWAQLMPTGRVLGIVKDPSGAVTPKAAITLTNTQTGITRSTTTNGQGEYLFPNVPVGTYQVKAVLEGFRQFTQEFTVQAELSTTIDIALQVGTSVQTVNVTAPAPLLNTDSGTVASVVDTTQIQDIPLQGRNPLMLIQLTAGVVQTSAPGTSMMNVAAMNVSTYFTSNGSNHYQNDFMLDGNADNLYERVEYIPPVDQLEEITMIPNAYDTQYGHGGGAEVIMVTKTGTNKLHGSFYEFLQNSDLNSTNFFTNRSGLTKPPLRYNQFGGALGGPIRRDRTFFFGNYEGIRESNPSTGLGTLPTAAQRSGDFSHTLGPNGQLIQVYNPFSTAPDPNNPGQYIRTQFPGNIITPSSLINSASAGLLSLLPLPNLPGNAITGVNNFAKNVGQTIGMNDFSARVDHEMSSKNHLFGRFSHEKTTTTPGTFLIPTAAENTNQNNAEIAFTSTISPTTVLELTVGYELFEDDFVTPKYNLSSLGFSSAFASAFYMVPNYSISDMSGFGDSATSYDHDYTWAANANMRHMQGRQSLKWGFQMQVKEDDGGSYGMTDYNYFDRQFTQGPNPTLVGANSGYGIASFLLGTLSPTSESYASTPSIYNTNSPYWGAYFQDDIRLTSKLTINAGLRWEEWQVATQRYNAQIVNWGWNTPNPIQAAAGAAYALNPAPQLSVSQFTSDITGGLIYATPQNRRWAPTIPDNFSPRLGFAYRLGEKTVVRGGFGLFYSDYYTAFARFTGYTATTPVTSTINGVTPVNLANNPFPSGYVPRTGNSLGLETALGSTAGFLDPDNHPSYNSRWNLGVQRQITPNTLLEVQYVGNTSYHIWLGTGSQTATYASGGPAELDRQFVYDSAQSLALGSTLFTTYPNPFVGLIPSNTALGAPTISLGSLLNRYPEFLGVDESRESGGHAYYNALQTTLTKRYSHGFTTLATYTWSKSLDRFRFINQQDPGPSKMISWYDCPQRFTLAGVYKLPFGPGQKYGWQNGVGGKMLGGWQLNLSEIFQSGFPIFLGTPLVINAGVSPTLSTSQRSEYDWFNTAAFKPLPEFTLSSAPFGLNSLRDDAINSWNISLWKETNLTERFKLQFRWELYNALNRCQFGDPTVNPASSSFGVISGQSNAPRAMQGALEVIF
jgi:hypothetical protein